MAHNYKQKIRTALTFSAALAAASCTLFAGLALSGCTTIASEKFPYDQKSFAAYQKEAEAFIARKRPFVTEDKGFELKANAPFELKPAQPNGKAVLLVHGLGDSPWTFRDVAQKLAEAGYLVRAVLLPGHGTKPEDLIGIHSSDWYETVARQAALLEKEYSQVWIGGFSTGGNLAFDYARNHPKIAGLILFSPALAVRNGLIRLAPAADLFVTWLISPDDATHGMHPFKYRATPMDALVAFKDTMDRADSEIKAAPYEKPVIVMLSEKDRTVNTQELLKTFDAQLTHPKSKIIWYGALPEGFKPSPKVITRTAVFPEKKILSFSHSSLTFSPSNAWYGEKGSYRFCSRQGSAEDVKACRTSPDVWRGEYGTGEGKKPFARLTFNPWFDWQMGEILKLMNPAERPSPKAAAD